MNKYLQRVATLIEVEGVSLVQCEVCGQCFPLGEWTASLAEQVKESERYGFTCSHQVNKPGEPTTYNGWANYDTWNVWLWLMNDEQLYLAVNELVEKHTVYGYVSLIRHLDNLGLIDPETPDGVAWDSDTLDYNELDSAVDDLVA
jgi:hypothetical protein